MSLFCLCFILLLSIPVAGWLAVKFSEKEHPLLGITCVFMTLPLVMAWCFSLLALADQSWQENHAKIQAEIQQIESIEK